MEEEIRKNKCNRVCFVKEGFTPFAKYTLSLLYISKIASNVVFNILRIKIISSGYRCR